MWLIAWSTCDGESAPRLKSTAVWHGQSTSFKEKDARLPSSFSSSSHQPLIKDLIAAGAKLRRPRAWHAHWTPTPNPASHHNKPI